MDDSLATVELVVVETVTSVALECRHKPLEMLDNLIRSSPDPESRSSRPQYL